MDKNVFPRCVWVSSVYMFICIYMYMEGLGSREDRVDVELASGFGELVYLN